MQQALELIEPIAHNSTDDPRGKAYAAITALRQALETEQKPVAWRTFDGEGGYDYRSYEMNETYDKEWAERNPNHKGWVEPLYTAPPKREWVGLTDEEINSVCYKRDWTAPWTDTTFARAIEAKLKEKNGGEYRNVATIEGNELNERNT
jgi:hypothetical protein